ncbi:ester cyclase [uncultured Meiothermus sp.]|jgi:steroid delta-isomerase-like uncharacterized protein|uniref:ester cyclase n=1 Tax=uncultured Meiothermus sp. TaxID=157471 RepID=UPI002631C50E|nr:ester cyclase [uncultured Meiothermus sp.]
MHQVTLLPPESPRTIPQQKAPRWRDADEIFPCSSECRAYLKQRRLKKPSTPKEKPMSAERNKAAHRRLVEEVWNQRNIGVLDELMRSDVIPHFLPPGLPANREGVKRFVGAFLTAYPDAHLQIEQLIAEGDQGAMHWTFTGTHKGELMGIPATGKSVRISGMERWRFDGQSRLVEGWAVFDQLGMMQQLGAIPQPS